MNAVIMDDVVIGDECIIGALSFVGAKSVIPNRKLVVGNPAKAIKDVSDEMLGWKSKGTELYQRLPEECRQTLKECEPLREPEENRPSQKAILKTWEAIKNKD